MIYRSRVCSYNKCEGGPPHEYPKTTDSSSLAEVIDRLLDKGMVIDA